MFKFLKRLFGFGKYDENHRQRAIRIMPKISDEQLVYYFENIKRVRKPCREAIIREMIKRNLM
jgi:hypothetical protein